MRRPWVSLAALFAVGLFSAIAGAATPKAASDPLLKQAISVLEKWDNSAARESRGGVLFVAFAEAYLAKAKKPFAQEWDPARPILGVTPDDAVNYRRHSSRFVSAVSGPLQVDVVHDFGQGRKARIWNRSLFMAIIGVHQCPSVDKLL